MKEFEEHQPHNGTVSLHVTPELIKSEKICQREGFIPHSTNKKKYYRCLRLRSGEFVIYEFSCNSETIWDQRKQMCSYPWNVGETDNSEISKEGNGCNRERCLEIKSIFNFISSINR